MIRFYFISHCIIYDLLTIPLPFKKLYLSFTLDLSVERYVTLQINTGNGRLLLWESYITINIGHPYMVDYGPNPHYVRRFAITDLHSDHYVRLARWLAQRCPWLAEYKCTDSDGYMNYFIGRIKPFNWLCMTERCPVQKIESFRWTTD